MCTTILAPSADKINNNILMLLTCTYKDHRDPHQNFCNQSLSVLSEQQKNTDWNNLDEIDYSYSENSQHYMARAFLEVEILFVDDGDDQSWLVPCSGW